MNGTPASIQDHFSEDAQIWQSLKKAISNSSGFQRWQCEQDCQHVNTLSHDQLVRNYLRETLETLAY